MENEVEKVIFKNREHKAKSLAYGVVKSMYDTPVEMSLDDVHIVWFCKTLKNWKALITFHMPKPPFVEVTYNGDDEETYIDVYKKIENVRIPD